MTVFISHFDQMEAIENTSVLWFIEENNDVVYLSKSWEKFSTTKYEHFTINDILSSQLYPTETRRNNDAIITSKGRRDVVLT